MKITFIIGGARSGKSSFALKEASKLEGRKAYIATAEAHDEEMKDRISKHQKERGADWDLHETPLKISEALLNLKDKYNVVVLDCLTLWLSNLMMFKLDISHEVEDLINTLRITNHASRIYIVSNEVGLGIVPDNKLARQFRDLAGTLNQKIAETADEVYMVITGIPVKIKG